MLKKVLLVSSLFSTLVFAVTSQSQIQMPEMPQMPVITAPVMDGTFYKPGVPYSSPKAPGGQTSAVDQKKNPSETVITDGAKSQDYLSTLLGNSNLLTASDISSLYDSGAFGSISSLTGINQNSTSNTATNLMLQQILNSLEDLKTAQNNASPAEKEIISNQRHDKQTFKSRDPVILRFRINNYNVVDSLEQSFFSEPEADGSFLLTSDRKYFVNQKGRSETFYLLFKTIKNNGSSTVYKVIPKIAQDYENKNSFVYKLCQLKDLTAEKTGNLVVLHYSDNGMNIDLLLDIDKKDS